MYKILIVEDDLVIAESIQKHINSWGYEAKLVEDFQNVMNEFLTFNPQLVLLDISLMFFNGYHWCSEIRKVSKVPIIFISSASDNLNIVMAMNMGGDDFISKPFDLDILTAKVQAILRRTYDFNLQANLIEHKGAVLNTSDATLIYKNEKIDLTKNEYKILQTLMENKGKIISRDILMTKLWENESFVDENTLTVNITRLRKKLERSDLVNYIITKKGLGYLVE
jgi:DNA-binding response OmpR family regulator